MDVRLVAKHRPKDAKEVLHLATREGDPHYINMHLAAEDRASSSPGVETANHLLSNGGTMENASNLNGKFKLETKYINQHIRSPLLHLAANRLRTAHHHHHQELKLLIIV
jgi:hypothetical protein